MNLLVGLIGYGRHVIRGRPHLIGCGIQRIERKPHLVFERNNMGLDGLLFCKRAEVSVPFLLLDVRFRDRLLLEHGKGAGKDPDFVIAFGISRVDGRSPAATCSMASRMACNGLMRQRLSVIMLTKARARAPASRDGWKISDSSAADRSAKALLFASSSAGSATVTALPMRPPVIGLH
jgi:hypothetical protein